VADVLDKILTTDYQLWVVAEGVDVLGAVVTLVDDTGGIPVSSIYLLGGDGFDDWGHLVWEGIEAWATDIGCEYNEIICRPGFLRKVPGYKHTHVIMGKKLWARKQSSKR